MKRSPQGPLAERPFQRCADTVSTEFTLVAQEPEDAGKVRLALVHVELITDVWLQEDAPDIVDRVGVSERVP